MDIDIHDLRRRLEESRGHESARKRLDQLIGPPPSSETIPNNVYTTEDLKREVASLRSEIDRLKRLYVTDFSADMETLIPASLVDDSGQFRDGPFSQLPKQEKLEHRRHNLRKVVLVQARNERARQKDLWKGIWGDSD